MNVWRLLLLFTILSLLVITYVSVATGRARVPTALAIFARTLDRADVPPGGVLLLGSSSMHRWVTIEEDLPGVPVVNRGISGAELVELSRYVDQLVAPYDPSVIVLYAGDNDLARGRSPEAVLAALKRTVRGLESHFPEAQILYIAIKPSPARWGLIEKIRRANALIAAYAETQPNVTFVDVFTLMLDDDGQLQQALYADDGLHLSRAGYTLWTEALTPYTAALR